MPQTDFTIADVLAWARTKPADERYDYADFRNCAICQFLKETDRVANPAVSYNEWRDRSAVPSVYTVFDDNIRAAALSLDDQTFGAFAARLAKLAPRHSAWTRLDAYMADIELASA